MRSGTRIEMPERTDHWPKDVIRLPAGDSDIVVTNSLKVNKPLVLGFFRATDSG